MTYYSIPWATFIRCALKYHERTLYIFCAPGPDGNWGKDMKHVLIEESLRQSDDQPNPHIPTHNHFLFSSSGTDCYYDPPNMPKRHVSHSERLLISCDSLARHDPKNSHYLIWDNQNKVGVLYCAAKVCVLLCFIGVNKTTSILFIRSFISGMTVSEMEMLNNFVGLS